MIFFSMIMAYVIIIILRTTGLMAIIGDPVSPVMALFGLPGESIIAIVSAFFAKAAGAATAANLYMDGTITAAQATILFPATITMGTLIGHFVRCVLTSGTNPAHAVRLIVIPVIDAIAAMLITRFLLIALGLGD